MKKVVFKLFKRKQEAKKDMSDVALLLLSGRQQLITQVATR